MCGSSWHRNHRLQREPAYLTNVNSAAQSTNWAEWNPDLPVTGITGLKPHPRPPAHPVECPTLEIPGDTSDARYTISTTAGSNVTGDQRPLANQWRSGLCHFAAGSGAAVKLTDLNGEDSYTRSVSFSAVRFILQTPETPDPPPAPTPTPPPPDPMVRTGTAGAAPGSNVSVPVQALNLPGTGLGSAALLIRYNPAVITPVDCQPDPAGSFDTETCNVDYERDGVAPDTLSLSLTSAGGVKESPLLANLVFQGAGNPGEFSSLELILQSITTPGGEAIT
jgi:hypothetical protein